MSPVLQGRFPTTRPLGTILIHMMPSSTQITFLHMLVLLLNIISPVKTDIFSCILGSCSITPQNLKAFHSRSLYKHPDPPPIPTPHPPAARPLALISQAWQAGTLKAGRKPTFKGILIISPGDVIKYCKHVLNESMSQRLQSV